MQEGAKNFEVIKRIWGERGAEVKRFMEVIEKRWARINSVITWQTERVDEVSEAMKGLEI
jgi:hypothetical protein